ncbi:hypothetical protein AVO42_09760 [Thiomicrospira sp. XS5]|uniref:ribonuclease E activity regulator RraA n=1 Tax=Thiomicrospira sp. XS5 TaxID=1775636 RepID=UPI0007474FBE|nr:ribonuclease E activity regulator RraA [Thiomicrospira sp. XS5]KUJ75579.1 hypothetical protein AVO42_09760 [Thiomicrospira sp. XS5]
MEMGTPDICDKYRDLLQVAQPVFKSFGGLSRMSADVETLKIKHDNALFWEILKQPGHRRILVVDAEGDYCAVMGDRMADLAVKNGWKGLLIHGYIRDSALLKTMPLGIWALGTCPMKGHLTRPGHLSVPLRFAGLDIDLSNTLYIDEDGVLVSTDAFPEFAAYFP